jgi:hypothetical protein
MPSDTVSPPTSGFKTNYLHPFMIPAVFPAKGPVRAALPSEATPLPEHPDFRPTTPSDPRGV